MAVGDWVGDAVIPSQVRGRVVSVAFSHSLAVLQQPTILVVMLYPGLPVGSKGGPKVLPLYQSP